VYGAEWLVTGGRVWDAAFVAAASVGRVHPGTWDHVAIVYLGLLQRTSGLAALLAAAILSAVGARPGLVRKALAWAGTVAIGLVVALLIAQLIGETRLAGVRTIAAAGLAALIAVPAGLVFERWSFPGSRADVALWACVIMELGLATLLFRGSDGTWLNYGIPATVFGAALTARVLARVGDASAIGRVPLPVAVAAPAILASSLYGIRDDLRIKRFEAAASGQIYEHLGRPRSSYYFTDRPGFNRVNGRLELVHDDWLYPVFESLGLAEPRALWLRPALVSGPVRAVVSKTDQPRIEGTDLDLRRLGYRRDVSIGNFFVWTR
jgi:hypothetical protein